MNDIIKIDGTEVKGGGQVLRNSASYAAILGKSVQFVNIRVSRRKPGLRPQYIEGLEMVAKLSKCTLKNACEGSQEASFIPGELAEGDISHSLVTFTNKIPAEYEIHTKNAATSLLVQASLPVLLFSPNVTNLVLTGGAQILISPSIDYTKHVLAPLLHRHFGVTVDVDIVRRDCMPTGEALIKVTTHPVESLPPISLLDRGSVVHVSSVLYGYGKVDQHFVDAAKLALQEALRDNGLDNGLDEEVRFSADIQGSDTDQPLVCRALVYAETSTGCILAGGSKIPPECGEKPLSDPKEMMTSAVANLVIELAHGGCTDEYLQDQLVIFMALADGVSEIVTGSITEHTTSALEIARRMTNAKFVVDQDADGRRYVIRCEGIGHLSQSRNRTSSSSCGPSPRHTGCCVGTLLEVLRFMCNMKY